MRTYKSHSARHVLLEYLVKAEGEGSRGGRILGHTRSGKPIYAKAGTHGDSMSQSHRYGRFTEQDHRDASEAHQKASAGGSQKEKDFGGSESAEVLHDHDLASRLHDHIARTMAAGKGKSSKWHAERAEFHKDEQANSAAASGHALSGGNYKTRTVHRLWAQASSLAAAHHAKMAEGG